MKEQFEQLLKALATIYGFEGEPYWFINSVSWGNVLFFGWHEKDKNLTYTIVPLCDDCFEIEIEAHTIDEDGYLDSEMLFKGQFYFTNKRVFHKFAAEYREQKQLILNNPEEMERVRNGQ